MFKMEADLGGYSNQNFKTESSEWSQKYYAFSAAGVSDAHIMYGNVLSCIEDANNAIASAGIEGLAQISLKNTYTQIAMVEQKRQNLEDYAHQVHLDAHNLVDAPFSEDMSKVKAGLLASNALTIIYNGKPTQIDCTNSGANSIMLWMISNTNNSLASNDLLTGDKKKDAYIIMCMTYDYKTGKYGFENELLDWNNKTKEEKILLARIYEYAVRDYENVFDESAPNTTAKKDILGRMIKNFIVVEDDVASLDYSVQAGKLMVKSPIADEMEQLLGKDSHGRQVLEKLTPLFLSVGFLGQHENYYSLYDVKVYHDGAATVYDVTFNKSGVSSSYQEYAKDITIAYCTNYDRSLGYVYYQDRVNPGIYGYQEKIGFSKEKIATMITAAENHDDMKLLEGIAKCSGNYKALFTEKPDIYSESCGAAFAVYVEDLKKNCSADADKIMNYMSDRQEDYSYEYYNFYYDGIQNSSIKNLEPGGTRYGFVDEEFIKVYETDANGNRVTRSDGSYVYHYGGDQRWFTGTKVGNTWKMDKYGCGVIAIVNQYLYITGQTEINQDDYMDLVEGFFKGDDLNASNFQKWNVGTDRGIAVWSSIGAYPWQMEDYIETMCANNPSKQALVDANWDWTDSYESDYEEMKCQLQEGIPVVWAVNDMDNAFKNPHVDLPFRDSSYQIATSENGAASHYVIVTAIYEQIDSTGNTKRMVEISTWGTKRYVDYDEYIAYVENNPANRPFSSVMKMDYTN